MPKQKNPVRGQVCHTIDGRRVMVLEKKGDAFRVLNDDGRIEIVYPRQFKTEKGESH